MREPSVGDELPPLTVESVSGEKMKTMAALLNDSTPIHWDVRTLRELGMGDRPINQGPSNMAYVMTMLASWAGGAEHLRSFQVRFLSNVCAGDRVTSRAVVAAVRDEGGRRLADCEVSLVIDDSTVALTGTATVEIT